MSSQRATLENPDETTAAGDTVRKALYEKLVALVGEGHVLMQEDDRQKHSKTTLPYSKACALILYPSTALEVQGIIKLANEYRWPVWPFSRGNNWGYGTKNALKENAIILVLERMNRIIEVNESLAYAVIEPGVSQKQLNDYLKENKINLWLDCTDSTPNGSILGNAIERGYGYTPYGDHFGHLCGLEVVLPNGGLLKTGGEHSSAKTWNTHKWGSGPYVEGLFSQSNLGVVVKGGVWLMPKPEDFRLFTFEVRSDDRLPEVINALRELSLAGTIQCHTHMVNDFQMLSLLGPYPYDKRDGKTHLSDAALGEFRKKFRIPRWSLVGGLYGAPDVLKMNRKKLKKRLCGLGDIDFFDDKKISAAKKFADFHAKSKEGSVSRIVASLLKPFISLKPIKLIQLIPDIHDILKGVPNESILASAYFKSSSRPPESNLNPAEDGCGIMWLAPTLPATGEAAEELLKLVKPIYESHGFEFSGCFTIINPRTFFLLMGIFFDQKDHEEKARALNLYHELNRAVKSGGFPQYRLGLPAMENFMENENEIHDLLARIKKAADPNGILAPGRYIASTA